MNAPSASGRSITVDHIWLFGNSRGRHSTDILSEFRISGQVKMYALK